MPFPSFSSSVCLDKYAVRFIPRENGLYLIDVKFNGSHIPGSPFKIRVGETGAAGDPGMVSAYGAGLEGGTTGKTLPLYTTQQHKMSGMEVNFSSTVSVPVVLNLALSPHRHLLFCLVCLQELHVNLW